MEAAFAPHVVCLLSLLLPPLPLSLLWTSLTEEERAAEEGERTAAAPLLSSTVCPGGPDRGPLRRRWRRRRRRRRRRRLGVACCPRLRQLMAGGFPQVGCKSIKFSDFVQKLSCTLTIDHTVLAEKGLILRYSNGSSTSCVLPKGFDPTFGIFL